MHFTNLQVNIGGGIYGSGSDAVGSFDLAGHVYPNGDVQFRKQYHGQHAVEYRGHLHNGVIEGTWTLQGMSGQFRIAMDDVEVWKGFYMQNGSKHQMELNLSVDKNGVFGTGSDSVGQFIIRGQNNDGHIKFSKAYTGKHTLTYTGPLSINGEERVIKGFWGGQGAYGEFELRSTKVKPHVNQGMGMPLAPGTGMGMGMPPGLGTGMGMGMPPNLSGGNHGWVNGQPGNPHSGW